MTRRRLSDDERALWDSVARQAEPLQRTNPAVPDISLGTPLPMPQQKTRSKPAPIRPFDVGERADHHGMNDLLPSLAAQMSNDALRMDKKTHSKMTRGRLSPEARIDLHGMTLAEAHPELVHFVLRNHAVGKRLLLVITGKGKDRDHGGPIPVRFGVLRHQVPQWLKQPPTGPLILQITAAAQNHGGGGAYYVYLRRK